MAPKRSAQPPPPVASSEEAASGSGSEEIASGSGSDESEEEIVQSPPTATAKNTAPRPQKVQQAEPSDEEEEEDEEEEAEEEEEEEGGGGEAEAKGNHAAPSSATRNAPPPPSPKREQSQSDGDEEETGDEAPQPVSAPKQEAEKGVKPPPSSEDKKPAVAFQRTWSKDDEIRILEALAAHRREHGTLPQPESLEAALAGRLDNRDCGRKLLMSKVKSLKSMHTRAVNRGDLPSKDVDRRIFDLSKEAWGTGDRPASGAVSRDFGEMCQLYPYIAEEVKNLERTSPGLFKREFGMIDDKARALDQKIKKQRMMEMKVLLRRHEVTKEVAKTMMDLVE